MASSIFTHAVVFVPEEVEFFFTEFEADAVLVFSCTSGRGHCSSILICSICSIVTALILSGFW
jgi:hypothetical protein